MHPYRITFHHGPTVVAFGRSKADAYRNACHKAGMAPTVLTRNIVPVPRPNIEW